MVSQLDQDTSAALANIRERRNSFVPINRFPFEVLSHIPIQLSSENDLANAVSVCRHWHKTFIQHAVLWSEFNLSLSWSHSFIKTRLERAKGSALHITSSHQDGADVLALLTPHSQQLQNLRFIFDCWSYVQKFSEAVSGPLPLLHTLDIHVLDCEPLPMMTRPSTSFFSGAVNLKNFSLCADVLPSLDSFAFPNLTTFELLAISPVPQEQVFPTSQLLDFLEATPTLEVARLVIQEEISLAGVLPGKIVVLLNVEEFSITEETPGYGIATHISCPIAKRMSLLHEHRPTDTALQQALFTSATRDSIPPQYMMGQIDEVVLELITFEYLSCSLSFLSPGSATLELGYMVIGSDEDDDDDDDDDEGTGSRYSLGREYVLAFSQACKTIQNHPQMADIKRLRIRDSRIPVSSSQLKSVARAIGQLFRSMGPLEQLTLGVSDLRPYLAPFIEHPDSHDAKLSYTYPRIKGLMIDDSINPLSTSAGAAISKFAKSQYAMGVPFDRVVFRTDPSADMVERLQPWVGAVCYDQGKP